MKYEDLSVGARKVTLYLRLEVGYALEEDIAERIVYHATKLELVVACQLDNPKYEMIAYPGETATQVLERLHEHQKIIREGQS